MELMSDGGWRRWQQQLSMLTFLPALLLLLLMPSAVHSIGCFICTSFNGTNPGCEDPFNSSVLATSYQHPCWALKRGRAGNFPADHCIKVIGRRTDEPSATMVVRTCALDSGTLTADTEIVRISHCGHFKYNGSVYSGCVQSCDSDGCNVAAPSRSRLLLPPILVSSFLLLLVPLSHNHQ